MVKQNNESERYYIMLNEGDWHDHPSNGNWKAWCYLATKVYRFYSSKYEFFREDSEDRLKHIRDFMDSNEYSTMCTGEKSLFVLAAHLYSYGEIPFEIDSLKYLDEQNFDAAITAIRIATQGYSPY